MNKIPIQISPYIWVIVSVLAGCTGSTEETVQQTEVIPVQFAEKHRSQFHFTPPSQWMNDPNGMVYYDGEYHLFYQHYPDSNVWGPMHWGHAVSTDLIKWEHLPIALYPDSLGYIFSGSAIVDWNNTSGFGSEDNPPLVAIYTYHQPEMAEAGSSVYQYQGIAYSLDKGRTWVKYQGNPVLPNPGIIDFRDPKVMWHEESGKWIMTLAVKDHISFYSSPDLKSWTFESDFGIDMGSHGGVWECPDLFELDIKGTDDSAWVLLVSIGSGGPNGGSATQYFTGDFDGHKFDAYENPGEMKWIDWGTDNYAGVTWSDEPDDRRIFMGWMSNWAYAQVVPTEAWRSAMTLPRKLSLHKKGEALYVHSVPVSEVAAWHESIQVNIEEQPLEIDSLADIQFTITVPEEESGIIQLSNVDGEVLTITLDRAGSQVTVDRSQSGDISFQESFGDVHVAPYEMGESVRVRLVADVNSIELFLDDGALVMTELVFPTSPYRLLSTRPVPEQVEIFSLKSIWTPELVN